MEALRLLRSNSSPSRARIRYPCRPRPLTGLPMPATLVLRSSAAAAVRCAAAVAALVWLVAAQAQPAAAYAGPLFDAHLHYNDDAAAHYPIDDVLARM